MAGKARPLGKHPVGRCKSSHARLLARFGKVWTLHVECGKVITESLGRTSCELMQRHRKMTDGGHRQY